MLHFGKLFRRGKEGALVRPKAYLPVGVASVRYTGVDIDFALQIIILRPASRSSIRPVIRGRIPAFPWTRHWRVVLYAKAIIDPPANSWPR